MGVLLSEGALGLSLDLSDEQVGGVLDPSSEVFAVVSSSIVSLALGEGDSERNVLVDLVKNVLSISVVPGEPVVGKLGSISSGVLVSLDVSLGGDLGSDIGKSGHKLVVVGVVVVVPGLSTGEQSESSEEFHFYYKKQL